MKKLLKNIWNIIFPKECLNCPQTWDYLCKECRKILDPHPELCPNCHKNSSNYKLCIQCKLEFRNQFVYEWIIVWFRYKDILKKIILKLKYYHKKDLWSFLAERLKYLILTNEEIQNNKNNTCANYVYEKGWGFGTETFSRYTIGIVIKWY